MVSLSNVPIPIKDQWTGIRTTNYPHTNATLNNKQNSSAIKGILMTKCEPIQKKKEHNKHYRLKAPI